MGLSGFLLLCVLHSLIALTWEVLMMYYAKEFFVFGHGLETAIKLQGSTPQDQLLIRTSDSFSGLLLFAIGFILLMVAFVKDREFQSFAKGCERQRVLNFGLVYFSQSCFSVKTLGSLP